MRLTNQAYDVKSLAVDTNILSLLICSRYEQTKWCQALDVRAASLKDTGWLLMLNPMGWVIEAFRAATLGHMPMISLGISTSVGLLIFVGGLFSFRSVERYFADVI